MKHIKIFTTFLLTFLLSTPVVLGAEKYIESTICFEDRRSAVIDTDNDANDLCVSCKTIYDNNWPLQGGGSGMGPITVLCSPQSLGGIDNIALILNPDLPTGGTAAYSLHYEGAYSVISPGDTVYPKSALFSCGNTYVNVGTGTSCDGNPRAVTLEEGHGLSDGFSIAEVFALKNKSQGDDIIKKSAHGSYVWVFPGAAAPVNEYQGTWYSAYEVAANVTGLSGDCDPSSASFGTCTSSDLNSIATYMTGIDRTTLNGTLVNKTPPTPKTYAITKSNGSNGTVSAGGNPIFNGTAWTITSNSVDIGNYFAETQSDGSGGTFEDFNIYKRRPICKLISCSGGGAPPGASSGCSAPGNAPCDYSFCWCYSTQAGCESGDANGDNVCYWDGSSCKGADNLGNQFDCESYGFYWNYEVAQSAYKCVGGNSGPHNCSSPSNSCTFMGKMDSSGNSCSTSHSDYGSISVSSSTGTISTSSMNFSGTATYNSSPSGTLPDYANCSSNAQCESGSCDTASTNKCVP